MCVCICVWGEGGWWHVRARVWACVCACVRVFGSLAFVLSRTALSRPADTLVQPCGGAGDSMGPRASRRATWAPCGLGGVRVLRVQSQSAYANTSASWRPFHCGRRSRTIVLPWGAPSLAVESTILVANIKKENARLVSGCEQCLSVWWASCSPGLLAGLARSHVPPFPSLGADPRATNLRSVGIGVPFRLKAWLQSAAGRHPIGDSRARVPLLASAPHP